ncbi:TPA: hypothetical protein IVN93_000807 [Enterococcus faecium]|nr:hypothetical protein [Enterococcus faecium]HAR1596708.1 hypothetical protein [Enterococcus faecium]HAR1599142.1 hypothetical protein [Enterococcus faecium]HBL8151951.1 hypothetical protein [Enterococcus faecium]
METISINGLDKSVANRIKKGNGYYLLKKGKYSVARELETMSIVYVAKNHFDVEQAIFDPDSEIGKWVELSEKTVSTKGAMIIEREMLDEIRVIIPKDTQMCEDSISDDEPKSERK